MIRIPIILIFTVTMFSSSYANMTYHFRGSSNDNHYNPRYNDGIVYSEYQPYISTYINDWGFVKAYVNSRMIPQGLKISDHSRYEAKLIIKGLTPNAQKIRAEFIATGEIVPVVLPGKKKKLRSLINIEISRCLDSWGKWHQYSAPIKSSDHHLDVVSLIDKLYETDIADYVRCELKVSTNEMTSPLLRGEVLQRTSEGADQLDYIKSKARRGVIVWGAGRDAIKLEVDSKSENIVVRGAQRSYDYTLTSELNRHSKNVLYRKLAEYIDFLKYDYGDILFDIVDKNLSRSESQFLVKGFLQKNTNKIKSMIENIEELTNESGLIQQITVAYSIEQAYQYIRSIEKKMRVRTTLDRFVHSQLN